MRGSWIPSIVPDGQEQTVYLVLCDFGPVGQAYRETDPDRADLESTITDLLTGQFDKPIGVIAFNAVECWAKDVSQYIACEITRRVDLADGELSEALWDFVHEHIGAERQLTLRLA